FRARLFSLSISTSRPPPSSTLFPYTTLFRSNTIDTPPFEAYSVTCGITFTFGGLRITADEARVLDTEERPIEHLFAAGELVGGLFYGNYPGGSGLTAGAVFGRIAGRAASAAAKGD